MGLRRRPEEGEGWSTKKKIGVGVLGFFIFLIIVGAFLLVSGENEESRREMTHIDSLKIIPAKGGKLEAGEGAEVTATVVNLENTAQSVTLTLRIDRKKTTQKEISLGARESKVVSFRVERFEEGTHIIDVGDYRKELEVGKKIERKTELMDDFKDVSGSEDYIDPALDINMVHLEWLEGSITSPQENLHIETLESLEFKPKVDPHVKLSESNPPSGAKYVYSLILDQNKDGIRDFATGIIVKAGYFNVVQYFESDNEFRKGQDYHAKIGRKGNIYFLYFYEFELGNIKSFNWKAKASCRVDNEVVAFDSLPEEGWAGFP